MRCPTCSRDFAKLRLMWMVLGGLTGGVGACLAHRLVRLLAS